MWGFISSYFIVVLVSLNHRRSKRRKNIFLFECIQITWKVREYFLPSIITLQFWRKPIRSFRLWFAMLKMNGDGLMIFKPNFFMVYNGMIFKLLPPSTKTLGKILPTYKISISTALTSYGILDVWILAAILTLNL